MKLSCLSDRLRASPATGEVFARDLPASKPARALEAAFSERKTVVSPQGGVASFQLIVSTDTPTDGAEIALNLGPFVLSGAELGPPAVYYQWPCQLEDDEWVYDALVPLEVYRAAPAEVREGPLGKRSHHAFWVDVPVSREAKPGTYRASAGVEGGPQVEVAIEVIPVELPMAPRMTIDLNSYANRIPGNHPGLTLDELIACEHTYYREAHDNRAVFHYLGYGHSCTVADGYAPPLVGRGRNLRVADWSAYDRRFGPLFDGSALKGSPGGERPIPHFYLPFNYDWPADFVRFGTRGYEEEWSRVLAEFLVHFQEKGWTGTNFELFFNPKKRYRYYPWDGDESKSTKDRAHFLLYGRLLDRARRVAGSRGSEARVIYRTDISWTFLQDALDEEMGSLFDLWIIHMGNVSWSREGVKALNAHGHLAWPYDTAMEAAHPAQPTMDLDRRILLAWRRGADGLIPNWLAQGNDNDLDRASPFAMLYPAHRFGAARALASIRLRRVRLATETTDLLDMIGKDALALVDAVVEAKEDDWWTPTPAWTLYPPEAMKGEMYGRQPMANPFEGRDPHTPAVIRQRAIDKLTGR